MMSQQYGIGFDLQRRMGTIIVCAVGLVMVTIASASPAATITGSYIINPSSNPDLSALGTDGWAYWLNHDASGYASRAPANTMTGSSIIFHEVTPVGGSLVRGSNTALQFTYDFSNGVSPGSANDLATYGVFNNTLDTTGYGVQTTVTLPDTGLYNVLVWVSGYNSQGQFTASLGAASYQNAHYIFSASKVAALYSLQVQADNPGDTLSIAYTMLYDNGLSAHVLLSAIAVSAVPEPATILMFAAGGLLMSHRRRRR